MKRPSFNGHRADLIEDNVVTTAVSSFVYAIVFGVRWYLQPFLRLSADAVWRQDGLHVHASAGGIQQGQAEDGEGDEDGFNGENGCEHEKAAAVLDNQLARMTANVDAADDNIERNN